MISLFGASTYHYHEGWFPQLSKCGKGLMGGGFPFGQNNQTTGPRSEYRPSIILRRFFNLELQTLSNTDKMKSVRVLLCRTSRVSSRHPRDRLDAAERGSLVIRHSNDRSPSATGDPHLTLSLCATNVLTSGTIRSKFSIQRPGFEPV